MSIHKIQVNFCAVFVTQAGKRLLSFPEENKENRKNIGNFLKNLAQALYKDDKNAIIFTEIFDRYANIVENRIDQAEKS